jgi:hypothetical protein
MGRTQAGAGRPKGSKNRFPRKSRVEPRPSLEHSVEADPVPAPPEPPERPGEPDPTTVDPKIVLLSIAGDVRAPAMARVAACKTLLQIRDAINPGEVAPPEADRIAVRAASLLAQLGKRVH